MTKLKDIDNSLAVFCLATYGEGDPTDNAMEFVEWLKNEPDLIGLNYAVSIHLIFKIYLLNNINLILTLKTQVFN